MGLTVALVATLTLAASAPAPEDAAGWRARSEELYSQGDFRGALDAAERARGKDAALRASLRDVLASGDVRREVLALEQRDPEMRADRVEVMA